MIAEVGHCHNRRSFARTAADLDAWPEAMAAKCWRAAYPTVHTIFLSFARSDGVGPSDPCHQKIGLDAALHPSSQEEGHIAVLASDLPYGRAFIRPVWLRLAHQS